MKRKPRVRKPKAFRDTHGIIWAEIEMDYIWINDNRQLTPKEAHRLMAWLARAASYLEQEADRGRKKA